MSTTPQWEETRDKYLKLMTKSIEQYSSEGDTEAIIHDCWFYLGEALQQERSKYFFSWDTAEAKDNWVVQFWRKNEDGSVTLLSELNKDSDEGGNFTLESLSQPKEE